MEGGRGEAAQVVIRPAEGLSPHGRGVVNGDTPTSTSIPLPKLSSGGVYLRDSSSSKEDSGSEKSHRDTFEGMDFDVSQMTESEQELARRHREIVAERKREQEQEKMERQRLEEILRMCAEYQQEVESPSGSKPSPLGGPPPISPTSTSVSALKIKRIAPPPGFLDLSRTKPEADQDQTGGADFSASKPEPPLTSTNEGERKISGEFRPNVTKIKTNGSLMLSSPSHTHKDGLFGYQMRRCESNSSTSEDEMLAGNSEDTGTIKRRPQPPTLAEEVLSPGQVVSSAHISLDRSTVPSSGGSGSNVSSQSSVVSGSKLSSVSVQHGSASSAVYSHGQGYPDSGPSPAKESSFSPKESSVSSSLPSSAGQSRIDEILNTSFEAEREAAEMSSYGKFSVHINAQISCDEGNVDDDDDDDVEGTMDHHYSKGSHSSTSSSKGSRSSESSNYTVQGSMTESIVSKDGSPTPVNSDTELGEGEMFRDGKEAEVTSGMTTPAAAVSPATTRNWEVRCCKILDILCGWLGGWVSDP